MHRARQAAGEGAAPPAEVLVTLLEKTGQEKSARENRSVREMSALYSLSSLIPRIHTKHF